MSILVNLLSRVQHRTEPRDIPPNLKQVVSVSRERTRNRKKYLFFCVVGVASILIGLAVLYYLELTKTPYVPRMMARNMRAPAPAAVELPAQTPAASASRPEAPESASPPVRRIPVAKLAKTVGSKKALSGPIPSSITHADKLLDPAIEAARPQPEPEAQSLRSPGPPKAAAVSRKDAAAKNVYLFAAKGCESKKDFGQALNNYRKALEADPEDYRVMSNIAGTYIRIGLFRDAVASAQEALALRGDYVPALINAGIALTRQGNSSEAGAYFEDALAKEPRNQHAAFNLALLHEHTGNLEAAAAIYRRMADGEEARGLMGLARVYEKQAKIAEAIRAYQEVIAMPGANPKLKGEARERLGRMAH